MAARNAASVLPEPVGAAISVLWPERIAGHASACAGVGDGNVRRNQLATAGWKESGGMVVFCAPASQILKQGVFRNIWPGRRIARHFSPSPAPRESWGEGTLA